ncbi:MAG: capsule biosynthesis protein CapC [candidate division Zixibacteria bacterium DG_27]|nr:MAG: capsule biosynthesis protein CapC [candidate division Zixibacteria bacterium DG_27]
MIQAVGLGLVISLIFSETLGLAAGGMVVPGYIALMVHYPLRILGTVIVALITFWAMRFFSNFMFIYGRRRIVLVILLGFAFGWLSREFLIIKYQGISVEMQAIGYIIPGLIANWMERQGVIPTISTMIIAAVLIRMFLMILSGGEVLL